MESLKHDRRRMGPFERQRGREQNTSRRQRDRSSEMKQNRATSRRSSRRRRSPSLPSSGRDDDRIIDDRSRRNERPRRRSSYSRRNRRARSASSSPSSAEEEDGRDKRKKRTSVRRHTPSSSRSRSRRRRPRLRSRRSRSRTRSRRRPRSRSPSSRHFDYDRRIESRHDRNNHGRMNRFDRYRGGYNRPEEDFAYDARHRFPLAHRSYSMDRDRQCRPSRRRRHRGPHRRRRNRSRSSFLSSSSASNDFRNMPRPREAAIPRAGVVSDDDDAMMGSSHAFTRAQGGGGGGGSARGGVGGHHAERPDDHPRNATAKTTKHNNKMNDNNNSNNSNNKRKRETDQSSSQAHDDTVGHFWGGPGTIVADTYRVERELGVGTFGRVVECLDLNSNRGSGGGRKRGERNDGKNSLVAIKIVRKVKRYYESALIEADIVSDVNRRGGPRGRGTSHFAVMYDAFNFRGHYCLVFESLGPSLYDYLKRNKYQPFPMHYIRDFSRQLLEALEYCHSFRLIHTDLKPENILVTKCRDISYGYQTLPESTKIKVIDFGGATYDDEKKSSVVNTRQYRAPEVILSCGWSMPSDLWSAGCILAELYQGELLFATHDNLEHLALMEWIIGPFPRRMLQKANQLNSSLTKQAFDANGRHRMERVLSAESSSYVLTMPPLESIVHKKKDEWFLNLLRRILVIDPENRSSARDALRFSFG